MSSRFLAALLCALVCRVLHAAPIPAGPGTFECPNGTEPITVFTYKPPTYRDGPLLMVFHGVGRNVEDYRNFAITLAERFGVIVVTPLFDKERFPSSRYQRGGLLDPNGKTQASAAWTYAVIPKIVAHVRGLEAKPKLPYYMIGHSAGGQFLVRLAAFMPGEAVRIGDLVVRLRACEATAPWEPERWTGAFVQVITRETRTSWRKTFSGWLYKESPSINVVEHPIYDVWVKACKMRHPDIGPGTIVARGDDTGGASGSRSKASKSAPVAVAAPSAPDSAADSATE